MRLYSKLKAFQKGVVDKNLELFVKTLSGETRGLGRQVTEAPTGSGKTMMMASLIEAGLMLPTEPNFVWITHNKQILVQTQNEIRDSIGRHLTSWVTMEQGIESFGGRLLLLNVQKGVSKKVREWLKKWHSVQKTLDPPRNTIFVIDEADEGMSGKNMEALREVLSPILEVGFTASFKKKDNEYQFAKVSHKEVIEAGMLVEQLEYQASEDVARKEITQRAIAQREHLESIAALLKRHDPERYFVPKMLVQAPARDCVAVARELQSMLRLGNDDFQKQVIVHTQDSRGLDELDDISEVRYIVGDLMVERGWNCPEAYVLLSTKDSLSKAKGIQLLGRVIRLPKATKFDDEFDVFNRGYIYIAGKHAIEESCKNFGNELPVLAPPREVIQVERRLDIQVPDIITFRDELDKDIDDKDLIPTSESLCDAFDYIKSKCEDTMPGIRRGVLNISDRSLTRNPTEIVNSEWNIEQTKRTLISALCSHLPRNYANLVVTKYQIRSASEGGLNYISQFVKEMAKNIRESQKIRQLAKQLMYVHEPYHWAPHKLVVAMPLPFQFKRSLYPKMHLNSEEARFATFLDAASEKLDIHWVRNDPTNIRLFRGHAPDFVAFNRDRYVFIEFKGKHLIDSEDSLRKNRVGAAAADYFMVYEEQDTGRFMLRGQVDEKDELFDEQMMKIALRKR